MGLFQSDVGLNSNFVVTVRASVNTSKIVHAKYSIIIDSSPQEERLFHN